MPKYKHGKRTEQLNFSEIQEKVGAAKRLSQEQLSYFWLLYYGGMRKSELYERVVQDCTLTNSTFNVDLWRKKGSAQTDPLEIPLWFPGMDVVCAWYKKAWKLKPRRKLIERWHKGKRSTKRVKAKYLFPNIHRATALIIVKRILGSWYYPHFLRLNRVTEIASDPTSNLTRIKSFTGIKSTRIIEENYMGVSRKEQRAAFDFMAKQIKEKQQS